MTEQQEQNALADYNYWFSQDAWAVDQAAALVVGLNPDVVLNPEVAKHYEGFDPADKVFYQLWQYSEQLAWMGDWRDILKKSLTNFNGDFCVGALDGIIDCGSFTGNPMAFIQRLVDDNEPMHFRLKEYLKENGYDFRHSKNSKILYEMQLFAKNDVWWLPRAARLVLGLSIDWKSDYLRLRQNFYRHIYPDYSYSQYEEVYHVMDSLIDSWKVGGFEFHDMGDIDPCEQSYDVDGCSLHVEANKFVEWAIRKKFIPPDQLLEFMGMKEPPVDGKTTLTPGKKVNTKSDFYCTQEMQLMHDAVKKFWTEYDLNNPDTSKAPLKKDVVAWLQDQAKKRGFEISNSMAGNIDTIIRCPKSRKGGNYI